MELIQKPVKFWPVPSSSGGLLLIDTLATGGLQSRDLDGGVLIFGGDSGVADLHCSNVSPFNSYAIPFRNARTPRNETDADSLQNRSFAQQPPCATTSSFETDICNVGRPVVADLLRTVQNLPILRRVKAVRAG